MPGLRSAELGIGDETGISSENDFFTGLPFDNLRSGLGLDFNRRLNPAFSKSRDSCTTTSCPGRVSRSYTALPDPDLEVLRPRW